MRKILKAVLWVALLSLLVYVPVMAQEAMACEADYVVRPGDWLKKIAAEHYGDQEAYLDIVEATNAKAAEDASYTVIVNPNLIQPGWKLCLPSRETLTPVTPEPPTTTQYQVGLMLTSEALPLQTESQTRLFPLRGEPVPYIGPAQAFLESPEDSPGIIRLALAHQVPDPFSPEGFSALTTVSWVLLTPNSDEAAALTWQEIRIDPSADAQSEGLSIQRAISETIVLTPAPDKPRREALLDALNARNLETGAGLWVDFILMEETDAQGTKSWNLYGLALDPNAPADEDGGITYCCRWWGCRSGSFGYCPFGCGGVCG